jgi:hypothetical protein
MNWDKFDDQLEKAMFGLAILVGTIAVVGRLIIIILGTL